MLLLNWLLVFTSLIFSNNETVIKHPYYVSVTEINYNDKEKTIEVSCKMFTNDLENILRSNTKSFIDIIHPKDKVSTQKLVAGYINKDLVIKINGKAYAMDYLGYEIEDEATWSYLQIKNIGTVKNVQVSNTLLYDYKKEQINIMHVSVNGVRKSYKLTNPDAMVTFDF